MPRSTRSDGPATRYPLLGGLILVVLGCQAAGGTSQEVAALDAGQLLAAAIEMHGGEALRRVPRTVFSRSRVMIYPPGGGRVEGELSYWFEAPDRERLELTTRGGSHLVQVHASGKAVEWVEGERTGRDLSGEFERRRTWPRILTILEEGTRPAAQGPTEVSDLVVLDGKEHVVLERTLPNYETWRIWLDRKTNLLSRVLCTYVEDAERVVQEDWLFEYKKLGGQLLPSRTVTLRDNKKVKEAWLLERKIDQDIDPKHFELAPR